MTEHQPAFRRGPWAWMACAIAVAGIGTAAVQFTRQELTNRRPTVTPGSIAALGTPSPQPSPMPPERVQSVPPSTRGAVLQIMQREAAKLPRSVVAAVFRNLETGEEAVLEADRQLPAGALVALPLMLTVYARAAEGALNLDADSTGSGRSLRQEVELMVAQGDVAATDRLIGLLGMDLVNGICRDLDLQQTVLRRKMRDKQALQEGRDNLTSARDVAAILTIIASEEISPEATKDMAGALQKHTRRDRIPRNLPRDLPVGNVTAQMTEPMLESDAAIVFAPGGVYVLCVMVQGEDTSQAACDCIAAISKGIFDALHHR